MIKRVITSIIVMAALMAGAQTLFAQSFQAQLVVRDNGAGIDTITWGHLSGATRCIDASAGEFELPPKPPTGVFDARFTDPLGTPGDCFGQGVSLDLRENITATDTFRVEFQAGDGGFPMTLSWPSNLGPHPTGVGYTALHLRDLFGGAIINVDMLTNTTTTITNSAFSALQIVGDIILGIEKENNLVPNAFGLNQNYPNPFNPTTTVKFAIEKSALTEIAVYDVLGRKVNTLVGQELTPGYYSVTWNGTDNNGAVVGTGMYYVRMSAAVGSDQVFSAVRKVMLMK